MVVTILGRQQYGSSMEQFENEVEDIQPNSALTPPTANEHAISRGPS